MELIQIHSFCLQSCMLNYKWKVTPFIMRYSIDVSKTRILQALFILRIGGKQTNIPISLRL